MHRKKRETSVGTVKVRHVGGVRGRDTGGPQLEAQSRPLAGPGDRVTPHQDGRGPRGPATALAGGREGSPGLVSFSSSSACVVTLSDLGEWMISTTEPAQLSRHPNLPKMLSFSFRRYEARMDLQCKRRGIRAGIGPSDRFPLTAVP